MSGYQCAPTITTERLVLTPLRVEDADEMVRVLEDERLHEFIGGHPVTLDELRQRCRSLVAGPSEPSEVWLNWTVRLKPKGTAVGALQASITEGADPAADVAWVIGVPWQRRGLASEAARALVDWLNSMGVKRISASIHPNNLASAAVAARAGLEPTDDIRDGERVWRLR